MRFKKIKFDNYRCFLNGEIEFCEKDGKNINLILGNNGAGKTEVLFAFWWLLYGFNFKQLKNKEATPYALNFSLYKSIQDGERNSASCSVEAEIEDGDTTYIVNRTAKYEKKPTTIAVTESQSIRYYKDNYELSLPVRDEAEVNKILTRIIPKPILNGIVFDGERMKQLSSLDDSSVKAIAGVINDITNVELLEQCHLTFEQVQKAINKKAKQIAKQKGNVSLNALIGEIDELQTKVNKARSERQECVEKVADLKLQSRELSLQLDDIKEARLLEKQRREARTELEQEEARKANAIHSFTTSIADGYLASCKQLFSDVEQLLVEYDVPADLTVPAAKNILARPKCICGNTWTEEMIAELNSLIRKLPPDNINSAMGEKVHQLRVASGDKRKAVKNDFDSLNESNEKIKQLKDRIASLSTQITKSGSEAAEEIENRYQKLQDEIIRLSANLQNIDSRLPGMDKDLEAKKKLKATLSQGEADTITIEKESAFVEKCLIALEKIKGANRITALKQINKRLQEAYKMLSDDYDLGRRIYIVQYDQVSMFQIITYFENQYQDTLSNMQKKGTVASLKAMGQSDEEIQETAILSCAQPNSTGQSKMNTLAFVKAILDFANEPQSGGIFEMTKAYPLLIDAPFGDIFDKNLEKSAMSLHAFTHQIILMLAKDSYRDVEDYVGPFVSTVHLFEKEPNEDHSNIIVSSMEEI
ncbi:MAG: AAA family ATPase [Lachnospiraceae bacterium]